MKAACTLPTESIVVSSRNVGWSGISAQQFRVGPGEVVSRPEQVHQVTLYLGQSQSLWQERDGRSRRAIHQAGDVIVVAEGESTFLRWDGTATFLYMSLDAAWVRELVSTLEPHRAGAMIHGDFSGRDPRVEHLGLTLLREMEEGAPNGPLFGDAVATALAVHLLGRVEPARPHADPPLSGLPARDLKRVMDYIQDRLSEQLSLTELARVAQCSLHHFARQFRRSMGIAPHQYVVRARVEEAKRLLQTGQYGVATVAAQVGFASQSHLSRHMRRLHGVTPGAYAKSRVTPQP